MKAFRKLVTEQTGQALVVVLVMLTFGGLTIIPVLDFATTAIRANNQLEKAGKGTYAAEAGIESVLWSVEHSAQTPTEIPAGPNLMSVTMQTVSHGLYTLFFGELIEPDGSHITYVQLGHTITRVGTTNTYQYTITILPHGTPSVIWVTSVGARLPYGFTYAAGSASDFPSNICTAEPQIVEDQVGAEMLNWEFSKVELGSGKTQTFYMTDTAGTGEIYGAYTWLVANREDVGQVGELTGDLYTITSTARSADGKVVATIECLAMNVAGSMEVISWQIAK